MLYPIYSKEPAVEVWQETEQHTWAWRFPNSLPPLHFGSIFLQLSSLSAYLQKTIRDCHRLNYSDFPHSISHPYASISSSGVSLKICWFFPRR